MTDPTTSADPAVTSLTAKAGDKVDNYTIMEQVGAGGTAIVFRGHDHVLNRDVAIKQIVIPPGEAGDDIRQRALSEAQMHKRVAASEPRLLVQYVDAVNDPRGLFMISEYVNGPSLEWILQQETGPMEPRQALGIVAATAKALDALHTAGIVHRDLKPSNILMPREGGLKLADFGLSAIITDQATMDQGSVRYMAPEILQGQPATPKSDLYALGMVAYELLAGRDNFNESFRTILRDQRNQSMRWVKWHTNARAKVTPLDQLIEGLPPSLSQLVARMMEKDPARRVGSCTELMEAIRMHFVQTGQEQAVPGPHAAMAPPQIDEASATAQVPRRSKLIAISAAMLVLWAVAIGGFFVWKSQNDQQIQADRTAALITAIEEADKLILDQKYEAASTAFLQVRQVHADQFDPNDRRYRDDLVDAGVLKADALRANMAGDFITALEKSKAYRQRMAQWAKQPPVPRTGLSLINAEKMIEQYTARAAFQERADQIEAMLDEGKLDTAIQAVRLTRNNAGSNAAMADMQRLDKLEERYNSLLGDKRITDLIAQAEKLEAAGDLNDAIDLLEEEVEDAGDNPDTRIVTLLDAMNKRDRIAAINKEISEAESESDDAALLEALKEMQRLQPTKAIEARINELEIGMMLTRAADALSEGRPEIAQQLLAKVIERDPQNAQAGRMMGSIKDARLMVEFVKAGDQHMANAEYKEAIVDYRKALTYGADTSGTINVKIKDATGRVNLANSEAALEAGDVAKAQNELDQARQAHGRTDAIADLQVRIDNLRDYTNFVAMGDDFLKKNTFGRAKSEYLKAKEIFDSEAINEKIADCDFRIWLSQCDQAMLSRDWDAAESALKRAEEIKKTEETKTRRTKIENRVQ